jgi:hypothetical protein
MFPTTRPVQKRLLLAIFVEMIIALIASSAEATTLIDPAYSSVYTANDLGPVPGLNIPYGGLTLKPGDPNTLLIGGDANTASGAIYSIGVIRDSNNHIIGVSGSVSPYAQGAYNDGGLLYGPGGVLFAARWPVNELGESKAGSFTTDKIIDFSTFGTFASGESLSAFNFVPPGFPGAGRMKLVTWQEGQWFDATLTPDGSGAFDLAGVTNVPGSNLPGGPEGFIYVPAGSPLFPQPTLLVSEWSDDKVVAYDLDSNGNPIVASRRLFIDSTTTVGFGPEGAFIDPLTGDFLFSDFVGDPTLNEDQVIVVRGFVPPNAVPEPGTLALILPGLLLIAPFRHRILAAIARRDRLLTRGAAVP